MRSEDASGGTRRRFLALSAGLAAAVAGCTGPSGFEEDDATVRRPPSSTSDDPSAEEQRAFGESYAIPGKSLTVTLGSPSLKNQVGRTTAPRGRTFAAVELRVENTGDERATVDPDRFVAVVDEERYQPNNDPQGAVISGIVEPGTRLDKHLYFPIPQEASSSDVVVHYGDGAVVWRP